jgi:hypothetical protein
VHDEELPDRADYLCGQDDPPQKIRKNAGKSANEAVPEAVYSFSIHPLSLIMCVLCFSLQRMATSVDAHIVKDPSGARSRTSMVFVVVATKGTHTEGCTWEELMCLFGAHNLLRVLWFLCVGNEGKGGGVFGSEGFLERTVFIGFLWSFCYPTGFG